LYARHDIPEGWVVDLQSGQIHFYREPVNGKYNVISSMAQPGATPIALLPNVMIDLSQP
jgi:Uma2 family endonuclease